MKMIGQIVDFMDSNVCEHASQICEHESNLTWKPDL